MAAAEQGARVGDVGVPPAARSPVQWGGTERVRERRAAALAAPRWRAFSVPLRVIRPLPDRNTGCLPKSPLTSPDGAVVLDELDGSQVLDHLEAQLRLDAQTARCPVRNRKRLPVHVVGKDRLRVARELKVDRLVVRLAFDVLVERAEEDVPRRRQRLTRCQNIAERNARPCSHARPTLNAVVLRDLRSDLHGSKIVERQFQRRFHEPADSQTPLREMGARQLRVARTRWGISVHPEEAHVALRILLPRRDMVEQHALYGSRRRS